MGPPPPEKKIHNKTTTLRQRCLPILSKMFGGNIWKSDSNFEWKIFLQIGCLKAFFKKYLFLIFFFFFFKTSPHLSACGDDRASVAFFLQVVLRELRLLSVSGGRARSAAAGCSLARERRQVRDCPAPQEAPRLCGVADRRSRFGFPPTSSPPMLCLLLSPPSHPWRVVGWFPPSTLFRSLFSYPAFLPLFSHVIGLILSCCSHTMVLQL